MRSQSDEAPLTVAFDAGPLLGPMTGVGAAVQHMATALERRPDVTLRRYACSFRGALQPGMTRLPLPAAIAQRLWSNASIPRVDRWLRPADVIHGTNYVVPPSRLPRIVTVYDCWFLRHPEQADADVVRAGKVLRRAVDTGAVVHATSNATAAAVRELLATDRIEVISLAPLPRDQSILESAPIAELADLPFILALGTLERRKNLPALVAAFGRVASDQPTLRLVLAGSDGDDRASIDNAIDSLHPSARRRVMLTGRIDASCKHWLLGSATLLAYPSLDEGFGFPLLEAMQHHVPIVASTAGSIPEVADDAAVLVDPSDIDGLAEAIDLVVSNESRRGQLIEAGDRRLATYSWADTAGRLAAVYRRLVVEGTR